MMEQIRAYVLHIMATALIVSVILNLTQGNGTVKTVMRLLCGIVMTLSLIQPVKQVSLTNIEKFAMGFRDEALQASIGGENYAYIAWSESICDGTEAYILEKAKSMKVDLAVEVEVSDDEIPVPVAVSLTGDVAPYVKSVLSDTISQELNIPKEKQRWISQ